MTREEQIFEASKKFSEYEYNQTNFENGFINGAKWADKNPVNVWHDMNDEPNKYEYILFEYISKKNELKYFTYYVTPFGNVLHEFEKFGKCRWTYISDLLPKYFGNYKQEKK